MGNRIQQLLVALVGPAQDLETMFQQLINNRTIDNATGVTLRYLAHIVGQPTAQHDDDTLRRYIRARIATNRSLGTSEDVLAVGRLVVNDSAARLHLFNDGIAACRLVVEEIEFNQTIADDLMNFLRGVVAGGVRIILEWRTFPLDQTFRFDVGPGYDVGHFADAEDNT